MAERAPAHARRRLLGAGLSGVVLAALLAPAQPVPLSIELRWLLAFALFILLPGWLLVGLLLPRRPGEGLETCLFTVAGGYCLAILLGLVLHTLFRPIAPWQIAAGGGLLVLALTGLAWRSPSPQPPPTLLWGPFIPTAPCAGEGEMLRESGVEGAHDGGGADDAGRVGQARDGGGAEEADRSGASPEGVEAPEAGRLGGAIDGVDAWKPAPTKSGSVGAGFRLAAPSGFDPNLPAATDDPDTSGITPNLPASLPLVAEIKRLLVGIWPLLLLLAVAAPLRLIDLGWSEFQGDEARVVLRAMAALQGADGALAAHRKVPGEILLAYLFAGSLGQIQEQTARLPYALAAVGAVLAFYRLARGLLGGPAALAAGLLLAVNGYFVAFGRILQYDSLAFFLGIVGLVCCWRFGQCAPTSSEAAGPDHPADDRMPLVWAFLGALLLSGAALVALGAVFLVPPALILAGPGLIFSARHWRRARSWQIVAAWGWPIVPAALAAVLIAGASNPADGPGGIWSYLGPRFGGDRPYWNGALFMQSAEHYLSSPYLYTMLGGGAIAVLLGIVGMVRTLGGRGIAIRIAAAVLLAALTWDKPRVAFALGALLTLVLVMQAAGPRFGTSLGMRVALIWAAGPLFAHLLLIRVPGTHFREAFPGLILVLAALIVPAFAAWRSRLAVGALLGLLIAGVGHYSWVTVVQRLPEYQLTYPTNRHPLDWSGRDGRGIGGVFGTVHRHGWKALGVLMADGALSGGYATNESPAIAAWYLRRPQGCAGALDYVFRVPRAPQDRNLAVPVPLPDGYVTRGRIRERGRATIMIQVPPSSTTRPGDVPADAYAARFDVELASVWRPVGELYRADLGAAAARRSCSAPQPAGS